MEFWTELNWVAVGQIVLIDMLLGGDNAIVIALACRNLPPDLRVQGILWGTFGAVSIRILPVAFAVTLLTLPFIKIVGAIFLFWIGIKLLSERESRGEISGSDKLVAAIKTIVMADLVMSVDNVIAIASAAEQAGRHQLLLVIFGILISVPMIVWGSTWVLKLMERLPIIINLGAALLGYLAVGMLLSDVALSAWVQAHLPYQHVALPVIDVRLNLPAIMGAIVVLVAGSLLARREVAARR